MVDGPYGYILPRQFQLQPTLNLDLSKLKVPLNSGLSR